jgi:predicted permease
MGIRLVVGRAFTAADRFDTAQVAIVNETFARTLWPGQDPIGQILTQDSRRVVGVVADVRHIELESQSGNEMYMPIRQNSNYLPMHLVVRTSLPPQSLANSIREALRPVDPNLPVTEFTTLQSFVDKASSPRRFLVMLITGFAAFALLLASLGIYALISYSVNQRVREIGIRMALGASAADVRGSILAGTMALAAAGLALGLVVSRMLTAAIASLLYGVTPGDPLTFVAMSALLIAVAAAAGYIPATRASRIDPIMALRAE